MHLANFETTALDMEANDKSAPAPAPDALQTINSILEKQAVGCSICGADHSMLCVASTRNIFARIYRISCGRCGHMGPFAFTIRAAAQKWHRPEGFIFRISEVVDRFMINRSYKFF